MGVRSYEELPQEAKVYLCELEDFIGTKISSISTSPEREDTILVENPYNL
jgi:adenylosuccinate synthase